MTLHEETTAVELAKAIGQLSGAIEKFESRQSAYPTWWQTWFSPATIGLAFTAVGTIAGVVLVTSNRMTATESAISTLQNDRNVQIQRIAALEATAITKEWLSREIQYQRDMYASKASVDVMVGRLEEFQRQLNVIETLARSSNDKRGPK